MVSTSGPGRTGDVRREATQLTALLGEEARPGSLTELRAGTNREMHRLFEITYEELRQLAANHLRRERTDPLLQPTLIVHEVFLKLIDQTRVDLKGRAHFLAVASRAMRRLLVDQARARSTSKRGRGLQRVTLDSRIGSESGSDVLDVLVLEQALRELSEFNPRAGEVAELRIFSELTIREAAMVMESSERTVAREWKLAKAWLGRRLR